MQCTKNQLILMLNKPYNFRALNQLLNNYYMTLKSVINFIMHLIMHFIIKLILSCIIYNLSMYNKKLKIENFICIENCTIICKVK